MIRVPNPWQRTHPTTPHEHSRGAGQPAASIPAGIRPHSESSSPSSRVILRVPESYQHACVIMTRSRVYMAHDRIDTADRGHHGPEPCQHALHVDTVRSHVSTRGVSTGTPTLIDPQNRDSTTKTITHGFCAIAKVERVRDSMSLVATLCMLLVMTCIRTLVSMSMSKGD